MAVAEDLPVTEEQLKAGVEAGEVLPSREQQPGRTTEEGILIQRARRIAAQQQIKTGVPAAITFARLRGEPGARQRELEFIAKQAKPPEAQPEIKPEPTEDTIDVGIRTDKPQLIKDTAEIRKLQKDDPKLFSVLEKKGIDAFNKAVSARQFVSQQEKKRFSKLNKELPDGKFVAKSDLAKIKQDSPEIHSVLITKGFDAANKRIEQQAVIAAPQVKKQEEIVGEMSLPAAIWQAIVNPPPLTEADLQRQFVEQQKIPAWARIIFLKMDVIKHPKSGELMKIPPVFLYGAGVNSAAGKQLAPRQLVKTIAINWNKLLDPKVRKPIIDWSKITEAIRLGNIKSAQDAARAAKSALLKKTLVTAKDIAAQQAAMRATQQAAIKARWPEVKAQWLKEVQRVVATQPISTVQAREAIRVLSKLSPVQLTQVIQRTGTLVESAVNTKVMAKSQADELTRMQEQIQVAALTQLAEQTATKLAEQNKTQAQIQEAVQTQLKEQIKVVTSPQVQTQLAQKVKTITKVATATKVPSASIPKPVPKPPSPIAKITKPSAKIPSFKALPIKRVLPIRFNRDEDNKRRRVIQKARGAIAWRQGELHGKDRWDVVMSPFTEDENFTIVLGRKPVGTIVVKGPGSAKKTAQLIFGHRLEKPVVVNQPGIFAAKLEPTATRRIKITFTRDIELTKKIGNLEEKGRVFPLP